MSYERKPLPALVCGADAGEHIWFTNNLVVMKIRAADTNGDFGLIETLSPAGFGAPMHVHHAEDEAFWVLEGNLTIVCADDVYKVGPGDTAFLPRDIPHTYRVDGDVPGRFLSLITPGGAEDFFAKVGRPAEGPGLPPPGPVDVEAMARWSEKFDMEVVGPPLPPV